MVDDRPTLESQGIDKNLAQQGRVLGALSDEKFEEIITATRGKVARTIGKAVLAACTTVRAHADTDPARTMKTLPEWMGAFQGQGAAEDQAPKDAGGSDLGRVR